MPYQNPNPESDFPYVPTQKGLVNQLRSQRQQHPVVDAVAGLVPLVGAAQTADDVATDPLNPLNYLGLVPGEKLLSMVGGTRLLKALRGQKEVDRAMSLPPTELKKEGYWLGPDGELRFEVDDSKAEIDEAALRLLRRRSGNADSTLGLVDHPELNDVPWAKSTVTSVNGPGAAYRRGEGISLGDAAPEDTLFHEWQHHLQSKEGRGAGFLGAGSGLTNDEYAQYLRDYGEVEARLVAARRVMTPAQRKQYPFQNHIADEYRRLAKEPTEYGFSESQPFVDWAKTKGLK